MFCKFSYFSIYLSSLKYYNLTNKITYFSFIEVMLDIYFGLIHLSKTPPSLFNKTNSELRTDKNFAFPNATV